MGALNSPLWTSHYTQKQKNDEKKWNILNKGSLTWCQHGNALGASAPRYYLRGRLYLLGFIIPRSSSLSRNSIMTARKYKRLPSTRQILKPRFWCGCPGFRFSRKSSRIWASSGVLRCFRFAISDNFVNLRGCAVTLSLNEVIVNKWLLFNVVHFEHLDQFGLRLEALDKRLLH